jgi:cytidine deaminase
MSLSEYKFLYTELESSNALTKQDADLLSKARQATSKAYAPYSNFFVGAAALLTNKEIVTATNQENASYPVGICAERVLLSTVSSVYNGLAIETIAVSYDKRGSESDRPVFPCGLCRQSLTEFELRMRHSIRLVLSGLTGKVLIIEKASHLLPLSFNSSDLF